jgi:hypothetical protein
MRKKTIIEFSRTMIDITHEENSFWTPLYLVVIPVYVWVTVITTAILLLKWGEK